MKPINCLRALTLLTPVLGLLLFAEPIAAQAPPPSTPAILPNETPAHITPVTDSFDYARRDVMIPMRDGVKLHTVMLVPKGAKGAPILLTRTPYSATDLTSHAQSSHLGPILTGYDNATEVIVEGGYIRVVQDVRGKYESEGDYVMNRPLRGPQNPTPVDHATDTFDTIDWLVKNVPESNGKVGILGISYDAFLQFGLSYIYDQEATRANEVRWWRTHADEFDEFMRGGYAGEMGRRRGLEQLGFWQKMIEHPGYDAFWRD